MHPDHLRIIASAAYTTATLAAVAYLALIL